MSSDGWSRFRSDGSGFAVPGVMFLLIGMMAILAVGAVAAVNTQRGTVRDADTKSALAVAESGSEIAVSRYMSSLSELEESQPCLASDGQAIDRMGDIAFEGGDPIGGWCPPVSSDDPTMPFTYWARPYEADDEHMLDIVSQGTVDTAVRRIRLSAALSWEGGRFNLFGENLVGIDFVDMEGNAQVTAGVGSNGWVNLSGSANVCGIVRTGSEPFTTDNSSSSSPPNNCPEGRHSELGTEHYPPAALPEGLTPETSSTNRFFDEDGDDLPDWYIDDPENRRKRWNPDSRTLTIDSGLTLRLKSDHPYLVCRLILKGGGKLSMENPEGPVQIFIDAPENCPGSPEVPLEFANGTAIYNNGYLPGIYILGSDQRETNVELSGGALAEGAVIYAPLTDLEVKGDFRLVGALIAKQVMMGGGAQIIDTDDGLEEYELNVPREVAEGSVSKQGFLECTASEIPLEAMDPTGGC